MNMNLALLGGIVLLLIFILSNTSSTSKTDQQFANRGNENKEPMVGGGDCTYKEWDLTNCARPFACCDGSSFPTDQKYNPVTSCGARGLSNTIGLSKASAASFTDKNIFPNSEPHFIQTPCGPLSTFNSYESPLDINRSSPQVVNNVIDNAIPPHLITQVDLVRRPQVTPLAANAVPDESPCDFMSEKTNLASFFRRNTNLFFTDEQQFPFSQTAWPEKLDCFNNIMYNTDLSPKEHYIVNKI
jgi:hypothetical protein